MIGNIIVISIVAILICLAVGKIIKNNKNGIGSCGCNCSSCKSNGGCSSPQTKKK
ncbi:MAG: FeoB-associated Cys-rich membrane protein [Lachnospiraceae bacterium]|nr:FeoB-associated Cys-rich membrane protein [Lachnospiraceae bacterium]